jgi:Fe-S-cluster containining protein
MTEWKATGKKGRQKAAQRKKAAQVSSAQARRGADGKLHLVLHPVAGADPYVTLAAPLFEEQWQNDVATSAANTALTALRAGVEKGAVVELAREAMRATSKLADGFLERGANGQVACKAGCDHCCHQSVGVTPAEGLAIVEHLLRTRSAEALAQVKERVATARVRTRGLTAEQRYSPDHPCPFLVDSACSIYEVRPLSCRGMNALDAEECKTQLRDPLARAEFIKNGGGGHSFMEPIRAFHAISAGIQLGLSELYHLDMRPLDLAAAVDELLSGAASLTDDWLAGKPALAAAHGGDSTNNPHGQHLSGRSEA